MSEDFLTKLVYIASPYSHPDRPMEIMRFHTITRIVGRLQDRFPYAFIAPITQSHVTLPYMRRGNGAFETWRTRDFTYILASDEMWVIMLEGWEESKGVTEEIKFAKQSGVRILYIPPEDIL